MRKPGGFAIFLGLLTFATVTGFSHAGSAGTGLYDFSIYPEYSQAAGAESSSTTIVAPTTKAKSGVVSNASQQAAAEGIDDDSGWGAVVEEFRLGILAHNLGPIASRTESGIDINPELLFSSPDAFEAIWSPRPMIGAVINTNDDTSFLYGGLMWDFDIVGDVFGGFSFGMAVHNGNDGKETDSEGHRALGCWWLFRESIEVGYRLTDDVAASLYLDHVSHGGLCSDRNRGMDNSGVRLHYLF